MAALPDDDGSTARPCLWVCGRGDGGRLQGPRRGSAGALDLAGRKKLLCARLETYLRHTTQGPPGLRAHEFREGLRGVDVPFAGVSWLRTSKLKKAMLAQASAPGDVGPSPLS